MSPIDVRVTVRPRRSGGHVPRIPFERIAQEVLGAKYHLSVVVCGDSLARRINTLYRKKTYAPNVLSFELDRYEGEIFLNIRKAEREARQLGTSVKKRLALLYVHGLFHLKGMNHSDHMERLEQRTLRKFGLD